ncbi:hypothetical protein K469DRAFT_683371 [Zopfia rhizophila CBS 207.26]|uniref:Uncharacterized protein n=1 Tax=Zopfia rhizophila CBS 207.26 TaxID=1314779 RepID=A0A6A6D8Z6_9PEZI|nr:hypothetical protein K469DRAFT_683371 [Zopfia rhizophila CBS 207.26]
MYSSPPGRQHFVLDPNFLELLQGPRYGCTVDFVKFLFDKYSQSGLTNQSDRDTVISGLLEPPIDYKGRKEPLSWPWMAVIVQVRQFKYCRLKNEERRRSEEEEEGEEKKKKKKKEKTEKGYTIFADPGEVGSLWFDMEASNQFKNCVVIEIREDKEDDP